MKNIDNEEVINGLQGQTMDVDDLKSLIKNNSRLWGKRKVEVK